MDNENNNGIKRFLNWVNADENLPSLEELEHEHEHEDHGDAHGGHEEIHGEPAQVSDHASMAESDAEEPTAEYETFTEDEELVYPDPVSVPEEPEPVPEAEVQVIRPATTEPTSKPVAPKRPMQLTRGQKKRLGKAELIYAILSSLLGVTIIVVLLVTVSQMPKFGDANNPTINEVYEKYVDEGVQDTGAVNLVAGMILDYRAFDTLGESVMLFTATMGVIMLIRTPKKSSISGKAGKEGES